MTGKDNLEIKIRTVLSIYSGTVGYSLVEASNDILKAMEDMFYDFPENHVLYKDSGIWNLYDDDLPKGEELLFTQGVNELFVDFIFRIKESIKQDE